MRFPTLLPHLLFARLAARHGVARTRLANALILPAKWTVAFPFHVLDRVLYTRAVRETRVSRPVFIVGHFRSGTTWLQRLLSSVEPWATPRVFQVLFPEAFLSGEWFLKGALQRVTSALHVQNEIDGTPLDWDYPGEEDVALFMAPFEASANWAMVFPRGGPQIRDRHLFLSDPAAEEAFFEGYQWFVRKVQARNPGARLVLKNPPNTCRIEALNRRFPDARFVYLHRDPVELFGSLRRFWGFVQRRAMHELGDDEIDALIFESIRTYHQAFLRGGKGPNVLAVRYEDLLGDPIVGLRRIWEHLDAGVPFPEQDMEAVVAANRGKGKRPVHVTEQDRERVRRAIPEVVSYWEGAP